MESLLNRRAFLRKTAVGATAFSILKDSRSVWSAPANERLNVALIGVGGRGTWFVDTITKMENVVALCDVNDRKISEAFWNWKEGAKRFADSPNDWERRAAEEYGRLLEVKPKTFTDFRVMLEKMGDAIDAVVVAIPDHTHGVASAAAIRAGKHVFCEKPLTRLVGESRALRELARKHKVATSMGNQGTASGAFRRALELIRDGTIGEIKEVHIWNSGGGGDRKQPPQGSPPIPEGLNWDLWLGPASSRPFHPEWMQRNLWRDFGTCQLGNWASHTANLAFRALKVHGLWLKNPEGDKQPVIRIEAGCSGINRLSFPRWELIQWHIPARAEFPPFTFRWYNGAAPGIQEIKESLTDTPSYDKEKWNPDFAGALIVGTKGKIHSTGHNATFRLLPEDRFEGIDTQRPVAVEQSRGHERDWFIACRGGKPAWANFEYADALNEFLMLGNVATQIEGAFTFDPIAMKITDNAQADALLRMENRQGWSL